MSGAMVLLIFLGLVLGPLCARLHSSWLRRMAGWSAVVLLVVAADRVLADADPVLRMAGICAVLLAAMKGLVYAEWARTETLTLPRYAVFSLLWFGMDPASFRHRKPGLAWREDVATGLVLVVIGTVGSWVVWRMEWRQVIVMFLPMSLGFHFGGLRVLKGFMRFAGFPVRTLFPNALKCHGVSDFWSRRWNVGYSQMMQRLVGRPVAECVGANAAIMAVFIASGLLHEVAITLPVRSGYGLPTLYFTMHGLLVLVENASGRRVGRIATLILVAAPLGILFPTAFQDEVIVRFLDVFDWIQHARLPR